jgi:AraC family transcriptional regulator
MKNDERGTFDCPSPNGHDGHAYTGSLVLPETPLHETLPRELSVVAAQLVEAACKARDGDREATRAHIAHAVALLRGKPSVGPSGMRVPSNLETHVARGGLPVWQSRKVFAHVEANLCSRIPIRELARLLDLSASHFCRAFKRTFGVSPRDYVLRRRIDVAQGLMLTTSERLSSIALKCGMCDQAHFTRSFHRIVGATPYAWRRTRRGALKIDSPACAPDAPKQPYRTSRAMLTSDLAPIKSVSTRPRG